VYAGGGLKTATKGKNASHLLNGRSDWVTDGVYRVEENAADFLASKTP